MTDDRLDVLVLWKSIALLHQARLEILPYSMRYVLRRFGMERLGRLVPIQARIPLPAGALEAILRRRDEETRAWI